MLKKSCYLYVVCVGAMLVGCASDPTNLLPFENTTSAVHISDSVAIQRRFLATTCANMRVRQTPDLQGAVVEILPNLNTFVEYAGDSTTFESHINYGDQKLVGRWYKVRSESGKEGWVFGGLAEFLTLDENKKIIAQQKVNASLNSAGKPTAKTLRYMQINQVQVQAYKTFIMRLSPQQYSHVGWAVSEYERMFSDATPATCDRAFLDFFHFYQQVKDKVRAQYNASRYAHLVKELQTYGRAHTANDSLLHRLANNGFKLSLVEGRIEFTEDIDYLARHFYRMVSQPMREYMNQMQLESETYWIENQKILIPINELGEWVAFWTNFSDKYPEFLLNPDARQRARQHQQYLIYGTANTKAFHNNILRPDFRATYERLITEYGPTEFGERLAAYYEALKRADFRYGNSIEQAQRDFFGVQ